jgi:hypothetical protein
MKNFVSVSTNAARFQDISLNPQKLAGMCAKLKCCLNYEVDDYIEASRELPSKEVALQTKDNDYYLFKTDILSGQATYSTDKTIPANLETISAARAREIIEMNKTGEKPLTLQEDRNRKEPEKPIDVLDGADLSRFDKSKHKKNGNRNRGNNPQRGDRPNNRPRNEGANAQQGAKPQENQQRDNQRGQRPDNQRQDNRGGQPRNDNRRRNNNNFRRPNNNGNNGGARPTEKPTAPEKPAEKPANNAAAGTDAKPTE